MKEQNWCFTFGYGQEHAHKFVTLSGTFSTARAKMFGLFGPHWSMQYPADDPAFVEAKNMFGWPEIQLTDEQQTICKEMKNDD